VTTRRRVGTLLVAIGGIATVVCVLGLIDPVDTRMSDAGAAFFIVPPWQEAAIGLLVSLAVASIGSWLRFSSHPTSPRTPDGGHSR
jgi:Na+(H+)/acetate symporter ActP